MSDKIENGTLDFGDSPNINIDDQPQFDLGDYVEQSYLNYAMYVVLDRALPQLADGLKPVQRRILYAMHELSLGGDAKPKKAARTIGDVIGKYHPHGDSASYHAMVHMVQPFTMRYPLIEGQGNWGSIENPSSFAAMRYTEAKLSLYTQALLDEISMGTVEWQENFDATLQEPCLLPVQVPNILANGSTGIAVGMTTHIPPHNLADLLEACILLLRNPNASTEELVDIVKAPDYPSKVTILSSEQDLLSLYETGKGGIQVRAHWRLEGKDTIIISSIPPQSSVNQIVEQIGKRIIEGKIPELLDIRDEGDAEEEVRIALILRSKRVDADLVMQQLFAITDLQKSLRYNFNAINLNGKPQVAGLKEMLSQWLIFRRATVIRKLEFRLKQVEQRLHILTAYLIVFDALDQVIAIIRTEDEPKPILAKLLNLDDEQVQAILELRLRQLAKLSLEALRKEFDELTAEKARLAKTLDSKAAMTKLLIKGLQQNLKQWGDERRCVIDHHTDPLVESKAALQRKIPKEDITVIVSKAGWVRSMKSSSPDLEKLSFRTGDDYHHHCIGLTTDSLLVFSADGRAHTLDATQLPSGRGYGEPMTKYINIGNKPIADLVLCSDKIQLLQVTDDGYGFFCNSDQIISNRSAGKQAISVANNANLIRTVGTNPDKAEHFEDALVAFATDQGKLKVFSTRELPSYSAGGRGVRVVEKAAGKVVDGAIVYPDAMLEIDTGRKSNMKIAYRELQDNYLAKRTSKSRDLPRNYTKVKRLVARD